jgi:hypothetical protein
MSGNTCHHDGPCCPVVSSVRYRLFAKKCSRRVRKTIAKSNYELRLVCLSVRPSAWNNSTSEISGFHRGVAEAFALLGCYAAYVGSRLPAFRNDLSVPSSRVETRRLEIGSPWADFRETLYWDLSVKSVYKMQVWLQSDKNNSHLTRTRSTVM